jgi:flagellar protein FliO/FliZ
MLLGLVCIFAPDAGGTAPAPPAPELPSYGGLLLRTLLALAIVVALVWILLRWGLRRLAPGAAKGRALRLVARQPLDGRRSVVLVEAAGRYLLLGVAEGSVRLLGELDSREVDAALREAEETSARRFSDVLREKLGRGAPRRQPPGTSRPKSSPSAPGPASTPEPTPGSDPTSTATPRDSSEESGGASR